MRVSLVRFYWRQGARSPTPPVVVCTHFDMTWCALSREQMIFFVQILISSFLLLWRTGPRSRCDHVLSSATSGRKIPQHHPQFPAPMKPKAVYCRVLFLELLVSRTGNLLGNLGDWNIRVWDRVSNAESCLTSSSHLCLCRVPVNICRSDSGCHDLWKCVTNVLRGGVRLMWVVVYCVARQGQCDAL